MARILIVDDEVTVLKNIARSLRRDGHDVVTAPNCRDARLAIGGGQVDALCLDLMLPDGNGLDLLEEIRLTDPHLPTVVISSAVTHHVRARAAKLGARYVLPKPFRLAELKEALVNSMAGL